VYDAVGEHTGRALARRLKGLGIITFPSRGLRYRTSANTADLYEALGLALPHSGTLPAGSNYQLRAANTRACVMDLLRDDVPPRRS